MTAILGTDGLVYTAGTNTLGSLCVPTTQVKRHNVFTPVPSLEPGEVVEIAATSTSLMLLLKNGTILGCGSNVDGRLSYFNVPDEEEHVLSVVEVPDSAKIKSVVGLLDHNILFTESNAFLAGPARDLASLVSPRDDGSKELNLTLSGGVEFSLENFVVRAHAGHQLMLQERATGRVWLTGFDPCSFDASHSDWHPFELGMLP